MASLHQLLPFILLSIFIIKGHSLSKSPHLSFSCGDGVDFAYPFWQRSLKNNHFGYPSLGVTCINKTPIIQLDNNHFYHVKSVKNLEKSFVVSFYELGDTICPIAPHDVVINSSTSFLSYGSNVKLMNFFYNCTVYPSGVEPIKCLQVGARHSYVFVGGSVPKFDWKNNCDSLLTVPVSVKSSITSIGTALKQGFDLKWSPSSQCGSCEASGGLCEYDNKQMFSCSCGEARHYAYCSEQGSVTSNFKLGLLSTGLLICCVIIAATILYIIKKRKDGIYKQGFDRLSTSGK